RRVDDRAARARTGGFARAPVAGPPGGDARDRARPEGTPGQHEGPGRAVRGVFDAIHAQRPGVALLLPCIVALAIVSLRRMPSSILPEVAFPRVKVIADSGELPSDVVLREVTRPLEESIRRVPGILEIRSTTSRGSCEINLDSEWGSDLDR